MDDRHIEVQDKPTQASKTLVPEAVTSEVVTPEALAPEAMGGDVAWGGHSLSEQVRALHQDMIRVRGLDGIERVSVAIYDPKLNELRTLAESMRDGVPVLDSYASPLSRSDSLSSLAARGGVRVIDDLKFLPEGAARQRALAARYRSSCTFPIRHENSFFGFVFMNAMKPGYFDPAVMNALAPWMRTLSLALACELNTIRLVRLSLDAMRVMSRYRHEDTGNHLDRMARYAHLIARRVGPRYGMGDEFAELLYQFVPLHDIGMVGVPDSILEKPGPLNSEETSIMRSHVPKGVEIVEAVRGSFREGLRDESAALRLLRNVVAHHHESLDGMGYPNRLSGTEIPLESRITKIVDVYEALTNERPYRKAWSNSDAIAYLQEYAGVKYDPECVAALLADSNALNRVREGRSLAQANVHAMNARQ